jgi:hypothetical protein
MARRAAWLLFMLGLALPAWAAPGAAISGEVKNLAGVVQRGVMIELFKGSPLPVATVFTDSNGVFSAKGLPPGRYYLKVSAPSFLPAVRKDVVLPAGATLVMNFTLNTLFEAAQALPSRRRTPLDQDDWKWTLRSTANRPILRVFDPGPQVANKSQSRDKGSMNGSLAFLSGSEAGGFGSTADMTTSFRLERSLFSAGTLAVNGDVGYGSGSQPGTVMRASYSHRLADGSKPQVAVTARRFATPDMLARNAVLQALGLSAADSITLADALDLSFGSEYQTIQFMGHVSAFRPFGSAALHLSPNTVLEYRYDSSVPNTRSLKGFDSAPADLSESGPRVSLSHNNAQLERAHHQEISVSRRAGDTSFQLAWYSDHIADTALIGVGAVTADSGEFLPDFYSGTFTYAGRRLDTNGLRLVAQRKIVSHLAATVDYSFGGVLALPEKSLNWSEVSQEMRTAQRHALSCKLAGRLPAAHTILIASYKWTSGGLTLTPVDLFNVSPGQSDPYLNIFVRQPVPGIRFLPGLMQVMLDVRNLLAQGYIPVGLNESDKVYLVQAARAIRGGIAFTF